MHESPLHPSQPGGTSAAATFARGFARPLEVLGAGSMDLLVLRIRGFYACNTIVVVLSWPIGGLACVFLFCIAM